LLPKGDDGWSAYANVEEGDAKHGLGFSGTHQEKAHSNGEFIEPIIYDYGIVKKLFHASNL
jgi:hypothetical protein